MSQSRSVLVLEDSVLVAMAIEAALSDRGFEAIIAGSLAAADERLGKMRPFAALLDLHLPDGDAVGLAHRLNDQGCQVAVSSGVDAVPAALAFARIFRKPVAAEDLAAWVAEVASPRDA